MVTIGREGPPGKISSLSWLETSSVSVAVAPRWVQSSTDGGSDEDVKGRKGSRPQTRPWRERAKGGPLSR
jgi:hypothetical protein